MATPLTASILLGRPDRQLGEGQVQHGDMVGRGVRAGTARAQDGGQGLVGVVQPAPERVEAITVLVVGRRLLLLGVCGEQGGVEVQGHIAVLGDGAEPRCPCPDTRRRPRLADGAQALIVDGLDHPPGGRARGDTAEQVGLVPQRRHVRQAVPAVGEHDRQVDEHPPRVMAAATPTDRRHRDRQGIAQPRGVGHLGHEQAAGVPGHPRAVRGHLEMRSALATLHF